MNWSYNIDRVTSNDLTLCLVVTISASDAEGSRIESRSENLSL
jgi:hypothetical protein